MKRLLSQQYGVKLKGPSFKLKWSVQPRPSGRYKAFQLRGWPEASYDNEHIAVDLYCQESDYTPRLAASCQHPITIRIADHSRKPFKWLTLKARAHSVGEAKVMAERFIESHPEVKPYP